MTVLTNLERHVKRIRKGKTDRAARRLFDGGRFLFRAGRVARDLGVIGEQRNCLILTLAASVEHPRDIFRSE